MVSPLCSVKAHPKPINWGGKDTVSIEDWCGYLAEITGLEARFETSASALGSLELDLTRMHELIGPTQVDWRDGIRRMVQTHHPDLLAAEADS